MGVMKLSPDECFHCSRVRREASARLAEEGATPEYIEGYLPSVLCREHAAEKEERERRERRNARRRRR
jgi:hypothetical protein